MSGAIQLTVDTLIMIQIMAFKDGSQSYKNVEADHGEEIDIEHNATMEDSRISCDSDFAKRQSDPSDEVHGI